MIPGLLIIALIAATFLFPASARAQTDDSLAYAGQAIAPAVVPQGEFAVSLAETLALETVEDDEDDAIRALVALGIEPAAGWQPDQAMTPQIVTELRADLADAIYAGRLLMEPDAAHTAFDELLAELGLPLPAAPAAYAGANPPLNSYGPYCDATATHYFYGSYGLPIYSYCYPPAAYFHYYSWVPCRFRAHGHHFSGFFTLRQVHVIQRVPGRRHIGHRFDGKKHVRDHKPERRLIRVVQPPKAIHPAPAERAWRRDTKSEISRTQSGVMQHKSEIMQRLPPAVPPRAAPRGEPVRPRSGQRVRFGVHPGASAVAQPPRVQRDARIHRETAPHRMMAPPAASAAPVARPAPRVATQPARHQPNRGAVSWSQRASNPAKAEPRAPARDNVPSRARFGFR
jgi:hypothetical protein